MESVFGVGFFCFGPLFFIFLGAWIAKGMPGLPFTITRRVRGGDVGELDYE